jgi:hypothetical protein
MVEKVLSDGEFYGQACCYGNEIGNISSPGVEEGAESDEQDADSVMHFHCQGCGYEDDTGFIICPVCGEGSTGGEEGAESEAERHSDSICSEDVEGVQCRIFENFVSAPSTSSQWPRWRRGVFQQPCDFTQSE